MDPSETTIDAFERQIGYSFKNKGLLIESLTHPSSSPEVHNNQRLEFLGDAVIQLILTRKFFVEYPTEREGILSRYRTTLAQGSFLTCLALKLGIDEMLQVSPAERSVQGHLRPSALVRGEDLVRERVSRRSEPVGARARQSMSEVDDLHVAREKLLEAIGTFVRRLRRRRTNQQAEQAQQGLESAASARTHAYLAITQCARR